jgi:N-acetylglutamate synthase-like GNAT family acetyltransferase
MKIKIRRMKPGDRAAAMSILEKWNMAPTPPSDELEDPERSDLDIDNSFVALLGDEVVGVCSFIIHSPELVETASLAVDPEVRGSGAGYLLQLTRLREMKRLGFKRVHTETDRAETVDWYSRKFGYQVVGSNPKKHAFSLDSVDEWTVLSLDLDTWVDPG